MSSVCLTDSFVGAYRSSGLLLMQWYFFFYLWIQFSHSELCTVNKFWNSKLKLKWEELWSHWFIHIHICVVIIVHFGGNNVQIMRLHNNGPQRERERVSNKALGISFAFHYTTLLLDKTKKLCKSERRAPKFRIPVKFSLRKSTKKTCRCGTCCSYDEPRRVHRIFQKKGKDSTNITT